MDFFTLINLLLLIHRVAGLVLNGRCTPQYPFRAPKPFYGRVIGWIPDNFGHSPFNTFDEWHLQRESVVEIFVTSSESIVLNVTLRCQQPDLLTGQLPPLSVWTGRQRREPNEWSDANFKLLQGGKWIDLEGCKQLTNDTRAFGWLNAATTFDKEPPYSKQENVSCNRGCNFINEFVIARSSAAEGSKAKLVYFNFKWIVIVIIILLTMF